jgi:hypothetical protein
MANDFAIAFQNHDFELISICLNEICLERKTPTVEIMRIKLGEHQPRETFHLINHSIQIDGLEDEERIKRIQELKKEFDINLDDDLEAQSNLNRIDFGSILRQLNG